MMGASGTSGLKKNSSNRLPISDAIDSRSPSSVKPENAGSGLSVRLGFGFETGLAGSAATASERVDALGLAADDVLGVESPQASETASGAEVALVEQPAPQHPALVGGRIGHRPLADQAISAVDRDVVLVAESGDRDIGWHRPVGPRLGLGELDGPARVAILLAQLIPRVIISDPWY